MVPSVVIALLLANSQQATRDTPPASAVAVENTNAALKPVSDDVPVASPARPTVTAPAHIPPTGYLQFEQGFNQANASPEGTAQQFALSQVTKIALTTRLMVQFLTQPYAYSHLAVPAGTSQDPGDLDVGAQYLVYKARGPVPTMAAGYIRRVRAGSAASLDVGDYSQSALVLLSGDFGKFHYDSNFAVNELNDDRVRRAQYLQSLAVSHTLLEQATDGKLSGVVELSHFTQPLISTTSAATPIRSGGNTAGLLFAAVYAVRPNIVFDAAFDHGLTSTSTQWQGSFGFTYLLPKRLWKDKHPVARVPGPKVYRVSR